MAVDYLRPETAQYYGYKNPNDIKLLFLIDHWDWMLREHNKEDKFAVLSELLEKGADINILTNQGFKLGTGKNTELSEFINTHPNYIKDYSIFRAEDPKAAVIVLKGNDGEGMGASYNNNIPMLLANELNMDVLSFDTRKGIISPEVMKSAIKEFNNKNLPVTLVINAHGTLASSGKHSIEYNKQDNDTIEMLKFFTNALNNKPYDVIISSCQAGSAIKNINNAALPSGSKILILSEYNPNNDDASLTPSYMFSEAIERIVLNQVEDSLINSVKQVFLLISKYMNHPTYLTINDNMHTLYPQTWIKWVKETLPTLKPESKQAIIKHLEKFAEPAFNTPEGCKESLGLFNNYYENTLYPESGDSINEFLEKKVSVAGESFSDHKHPICNIKTRLFEKKVLPVVEKFFNNQPTQVIETSGILSAIYEYMASEEFAKIEPEVSASLFQVIDAPNNLDRKLWINADDNPSLKQHLLSTIHPQIIFGESLRNKVNKTFTDEQIKKLISYALQHDLKKGLHGKLDQHCAGAKECAASVDLLIEKILDPAYKTLVFDAVHCTGAKECAASVDLLIEKILDPAYKTLVFDAVHHYQNSDHKIIESPTGILPSNTYSGLKVAAVLVAECENPEVGVT